MLHGIIKEDIVVWLVVALVASITLKVTSKLPKTILIIIALVGIVVLYIPKYILWGEYLCLLLKFIL